MKRIRGGSGFGDSIYLRPIADYLISQGDQVTVLSDYPAVFLGSTTIVKPFQRIPVEVVGHYVNVKSNQATTQWADVCTNAGVPVLSFTFPWVVQNQEMVDDLVAKAEGRPLILVHGGREPFNRTDGFGNALLPDRVAFNNALDAMEGTFQVQIGKGVKRYPLRCDVDLNDHTSVADILDLAYVCDGIVSQCSFAVPLAEVFDKPLLVVWASLGLRSPTAYISSITPKKILSKVTSRYVIDDWQQDRLQEAARVFRQLG